MSRRPSAILVALLLAVPSAAEAGRAQERPGHGHRAKAAKARAHPARPAARARTRLERARAQLAAVKRDPLKRKFRHHWERAIRALVAAARGKDTGPALLDAGRARYALYRFSQVESDRDEALRLAARARRAGAREAAAFAAAVRREAGDDEPRPARKKALARSARKPARSAAHAPRAPEPEPADEPDDGPLDEALNKALAAGEGDAARPSPRPFEPRPEAAAEEPLRVAEIHSWSSPDSTRVAVALSRPAGFTRHEIPADATHPRRVAIDIPGAVLEGAAAAHPIGDGLVERVRTGQNGPDTVRVVLDLRGDQDVRVAALQDPPQLLIDVGAARPAPAPSPAPPERPAAAGAALGAEFAANRPIHRIIVDAGHGGHDSGAIGPTRVREKDVTLAIAKRLKARLQERGYEVLLTRKDDRYLRLDERTWFANERKGDLFISIHANAHPRRDRRGTETFVLNVADDRYARRLAARENGALSDEAGEGPEVKHILADLDAQSSAAPSQRLAHLVQRDLVAGIRQRTGSSRDLGVKSALFYVLLGARMPAVLVETAFISNRAEEKRLKDPRFQDTVATSVARAVDTFARGQARVAAR